MRLISKSLVWGLAAVLTIRVGAKNSSQIVLDALESMVDCQTCLAALHPLQAIALTGDDPFDDALIFACDVTKMDDPDVCSGIMTRLGPIIAHDLRSISTVGQTAERLCDALFGFCASKTPNPFTVPMPPPSVSTGPSPPITRKKPFQVVHISDVHIDRDYTVGSEANCTKSICCRNFADEAGEPITEPAQPFGNLNCDSPVPLAESMLAAVNSFDASFVILTGDIQTRDTWLTTRHEVNTNLEDFNAEMLQSIRAPIFPGFGNHDSNPVNSFPRNTTDTIVHNIQWAFDTQSAGWEHWIGTIASQQVIHISGSYAATVPDMNLVILSINTMYWYRQNLWLYDSDEFQPDPNGILSFMVEQLQAAEDARKKVWVIGHIPPGKPDTVEDASNYYNQVLQRYKSTIVGQFFGHSHKDQFEIAYSDYNDQTAANAVGVGLICPALTPNSGNPAFKVYDVDPDTFGIMDIRVIFANLTDPTFQKHPTWGLYYSARDTYGPLVGLPADSELTPAFWHKLTEVFTTNDTAFQMFNTFLSRGGAVTPCDATDNCQNTTICDMRALRSQNNCDPDSGSFSFRRRDVGRTQQTESSECEGVGIKEMFAEIQSNLWAKFD